MHHVILGIQPAQHQHLQRHPHRRRGGQGTQQPQPKGAGDAGKPGGKVGPHHEQAPVGKIDEVHHAEHQRQAGGNEKQRHAELKSVQRLFKNEG